MPCLLVFRKNFPQSISKVWTGDKIFCVVVKNILKMSLTCGQKQTLFVNRYYRFSSIFRKSSLSIIETNLKQTVKKVSFQIIKKKCLERPMATRCIFCIMSLLSKCLKCISLPFCCEGRELLL